MIYRFSKINGQRDFEIVEKKCIGHPDTLADGLAEYLSQRYSIYTKSRFRAILHHNFDKVGLLGGASYVKFGEGYLTSPIRVLLNGRASTKFGEEVIPVNDLLTNWSKEFLGKRLPLLNVDKDLVFHYNLSNQSSPGKTDEVYKKEGTRKYWFEPRGLFDLQEHSKLFSNDTSLGVGYAPFSMLENIVNSIAKRLTSEEFRLNNPWIGSDIKIMGYRNKEDISVTLCVPQIGKYVSSADEYRHNIDKTYEIVKSIIESYSVVAFEVNINTRDDYDKAELYLTAIGTSLESGDEGLVGRGNRINGLITPMRPMSMEGAAGKNPVYHIGKVYHVIANLIADKIYSELGVANEVFLISQSGRDLADPWVVHVNVEETVDEKKVRNIVDSLLSTFPYVTNEIVNNHYTVY